MADNGRVLDGVFAVLVGLTAASWFVGYDHGLGDHNAALLVLLTITFGKVWLIGRYFMEVRDAPTLLRRGLDAYCLIVPAALAVLAIGH